MPLFNSPRGYGALTKLLHWLVALLFALQYVSATVMLRTPADGTTLGLGQATVYNWHKSLGLIALAFAVARLVNRRIGELPPWAPTLTALEHKIIHRSEQLLYAAMLVMPVSGFVFVMAGGYGVRFLDAIDLPNVVPYSPRLAALAEWTHIATAKLLLLPLGTHLGLVLGHHLGLRDRLIARMLPGRDRS